MTNFHPDTRGQRWSLIWTHLSSCIVGREGLCTQISLMCGECSQCMDCIGFAPLMAACAFQVYTAQAPGCSAGALSKADPASRALPRSKLLGFLGALQGHRPRWAVHFVPFPGLSSAGNWVLGECTILVMPCISSGELISGCDTPGRCQLPRIPGRHG